MIVWSQPSGAGQWHTLCRGQDSATRKPLKDSQAARSLAMDRRLHARGIMAHDPRRRLLPVAACLLFAVSACVAHSGSPSDSDPSAAGQAGASADAPDHDGTAGASAAQDGAAGSDPSRVPGEAGSGNDSGGGAKVSQAGAGSVQPEGDLDAWYADATVSHRKWIPVPGPSAILAAAPIVRQLKDYDPGSLLRCEVQDDPAYREVVDEIGGVIWGYSVGFLVDESQPQFQAGFLDYQRTAVPGATSNEADGAAVEIEEADIIGLSSTSALYYSTEHGLLLVDLSGTQPEFDCATKLPGRVNKFFYYQGHLVAMTEQITGSARHSYLLHFDVNDGALRFIEAIDLGAVRILDTRRFNERLVVYTDLTLEDQQPQDTQTAIPQYYEPRGLHRSLRVFTFGDTLTEEMNDTLLDTSPDSSYLTDGAIAEGTAPGTLVYESSNFGQLMWASDHYFVVTEQLRKTHLASWQTRTYSVCVASHTVEVPYEYCRTLYEERPNPDYTPPDNSGGDRACNGQTLSDCLRAVSRAANPTIQVPVGRECNQSVRTHWICDARESRSYTYPNLDTETATRLYIYEYTPDGFVRLDTEVSEITNQGLDEQSPGEVIPTLTTSADTYDLAVPGTLQTLYFQNEMLYAIADGILQVYAMGGPSLVRTSSLDVVDQGLQTSLFTSDKLYLSDFGYSGGHDQSVLRVIDLSNPAFPRQASQDRTLPGGHRTILPVQQGILTIGSVANFEPGIQQVLKLGLFTDPFASELSYLILGTDLSYSYLGEDKSHAFDASSQRLFLPYYGTERDTARYVARVGVSHLEDLEIVSEGAVPMPELPQRVRLRPGATDQALSFASSSVEWLRPAGAQWAATPVLEYFKPIALYRLTDDDDYVEVLRLGQSCMLHFSAADTINVTRDESVSDVFECGTGYPWAYANNIIFSPAVAVSFTPEGETTLLDEEAIAELYELRPRRPYCLFSDELMTNVGIDYNNPPPLDNVVCYTPEEYQDAYDAARGATSTE
jgi:hypothetical protein